MDAGRRQGGLACLVIVVAAVAGCRREEIQVYHVPKDPPPPSETARREGTGRQTGQEDLTSIRWNLPDGWEVMPEAPARAPSFALQGAQGGAARVAVIPLRGMGGSDVDFVNLWREQLHMEPITASSLSEYLQEVEINAQAGKLFDVLGKAAPAPAAASLAGRILVAVLEREGTTWFFKLQGDESAVEEHRSKFLAFLKTLTFVDEASGSEMRAANQRGLSTNDREVPKQGQTPARPEWSVPAGWVETPPTEMVLAKYVIGGPKSKKAEVTVSVFAGEAGGLLINVNRWRNQVSLQPVGEKDLSDLAKPLDVPGGKGILVDMPGSDPKTGEASRIVAAIVPHEGNTWYYKLLGNDEIANREKTGFLTFVQTARYANVP